MRIPLVHFDCRLVVLSSFIVIAAAYVTLVVVDRMKAAQGMAGFAWLGGGASGIGVGIWLMHYFGWRTLTMTAPKLDRSSVICSIVATIFASGLTLLVVSGRSDSGRANWSARSTPRLGCHGVLRKPPLSIHCSNKSGHSETGGTLLGRIPNPCPTPA